MLLVCVQKGGEGGEGRQAADWERQTEQWGEQKDLQITLSFAGPKV